MSEFDWLAPRKSPEKAAFQGWLFFAAASALAVLTALAVTWLDKPEYLVLAAIVLPVLAAVFIKPEIGLLLLVFVTFTRGFEVIMENEGALSPYTAYLAFLALVLAIRRVLFDERISGWETPVVVFGLFGFIAMSSILYARYPSIVTSELVLFTKDAFMALLIVVMIARAGLLRQAVWVLLAAAIFLGGISTYQQLTGSFDNTFWGFGKLEVMNIIEETEGNRISGPGLGPNLYAQYMLVLVPLAWDRFWHEKKKVLRLLAGVALLLTIAAIIFTFSRSTFIGLVVVVGLLVLMRPNRLATISIAMLILLVMLPFIPEQYTQRLVTLRYILPDIIGDEGGATEMRQATGEVSFRGRLSENIVGMQMTLDHPILGVGYANFKPTYQTYSRRLGLDPRRVGRSAHNLYLEFSAELGIVGIFFLVFLNWTTFRGLIYARSKFLALGRPDHAGIASAMMVSVLGLMFTSIFLHMAYPRYFWMVYALALAVPHAAKQEVEGQLTAGSLQRSNSDLYQE